MTPARKTTTPRTTRKTGKTSEAPEQATERQDEGTLRVAGVAEPLDETQCRVSGCLKNAQYNGLCAGHFASRRGDGSKPGATEQEGELNRE